MRYSLKIPQRALTALALTILGSGLLFASAAQAQTTVVVANSANNQIASYALGGASPLRSIAGPPAQPRTHAVRAFVLTVSR